MDTGQAGGRRHDPICPPELIAVLHPAQAAIDHSEKLASSHEVTAFADLVYELARNLPAEERFGLTHLMRRAAASLSSNIAEGSSPSSRSDYVRFLEIATGSLFEVVSQATIGQHRGFLSREDYQRLYTAAEKQSRMLSGLRKSLEAH